MLIDEIEIFVCSGRGGDGMMHFRREKFVPRGGPDGGDGGRGGDVVLKVTTSLNTLNSFRHKTQFIAPNGLKGGAQKQTGRSAENLVILVPPGTIVYNVDTKEMVGDLVEIGQTLTVCKGGRGGLGNPHFASSTNQAPHTAERGEPGQEQNLRLVLKLIADIGLVGVPNAGKSSFLAAVSNARPKIANYPFTTLEPNLGVVEMDLENTLVLADIPGLIEGAHLGVGLGNTFLKHIQRTRVIIHVLDGMSADPISDFTQTNSEMALFDAKLSSKPQLVVFNKMDMPEAQEQWPEIKATLSEKGYECYPISALTHKDLIPVLWRATELLKETPKPETQDLTMPVYRTEEDPEAFTIEREQAGWRVRGAAIERSAEMTYWNYPGSVRRFQRMMDRLGVENALRKAGIVNGDTVLVGEYELDWED